MGPWPGIVTSAGSFSLSSVIRVPSIEEVMIPETLQEWSLETVKYVAESGIIEDDRFDLKADLQPANHQRRVVAAFANTRGGFLVFGVSNSRELVGVENRELPRDFANKLHHGLTPSVEYEFGAPMPVGTASSIYVCHIPPSKRSPHAVLESEVCIFLKRTPAGTNQSMSFEEIRACFVESGAMRSYIQLLCSEFGRMKQLGERLNVDASTTEGGFLLHLRTTKYNTSYIRMALPLVFPMIGEDSALVKSIYDLLEAADSADNSMAPFSNQLDPHNLRASQEYMVRKLTREYGIQISHAAVWALSLLENSTYSLAPA